MDRTEPDTVRIKSMGLPRGTVESQQEAPQARSPKRPSVETAGMADIFPYYAGFSFNWARERLQISSTAPPITVVDPWNGSGTTTLAAQCAGHRAIGVDLNPVANVISHLRCNVGSKARPLPALPPQVDRSEAYVSDALSNWFTPQVVARFRDWTDCLAYAPDEVSYLGKVALFRVVRSLTKGFGGSNPTWVKRAKDPGELIDCSAEYLDHLILDDQTALLDRLSDAPSLRTQAALITAASARLPIRSQSVDFVLTSPPYLTRIDYAIAYSRELAILNTDVARSRTLRSELMGTTLIRPDSIEPSNLGLVAGRLLRDISLHKSWASGVYYLKQAKQYINDLCGGLDEISRVSKPGAEMCLVVQDSYYKDIPVKLAEICVEEAEIRNWKFVKVKPFVVARTLASLNTAARAYEKGEVAESVIHLRRLG